MSERPANSNARRTALEHDLAEAEVVFQGLVVDAARARCKGDQQASAAVEAALRVAEVRMHILAEALTRLPALEQELTEHLQMFEGLATQAGQARRAEDRAAEALAMAALESIETRIGTLHHMLTTAIAEAEAIRDEVLALQREVAQLTRERAQAQRRGDWEAERTLTKQMRGMLEQIRLLSTEAKTSA